MVLIALQCSRTPSWAIHLDDACHFPSAIRTGLTLHARRTALAIDLVPARYARKAWVGRVANNAFVGCLTYATCIALWLDELNVVVFIDLRNTSMRHCSVRRWKRRMHLTCVCCMLSTTYPFRSPFFFCLVRTTRSHSTLGKSGGVAANFYI